MSNLKNNPQKPVERKETSSHSTGKIRISTKRRIIQRVIFALLFSGAIIAAHEAGWLDNISHQLSTQKINWLDNKEVTQYLRKVITNQKLTDTPSNCLVFVINNDTRGDIVDLQVREQHNNTCTNTRNDFPLLFTFRVNRTNGNIQIDKGSPNYFYPIH